MGGVEGGLRSFILRISGLLDGEEGRALTETQLGLWSHCPATERSRGDRSGGSVGRNKSLVGGQFSSLGKSGQIIGLNRKERRKLETEIWRSDTST